MQQTVNIRSKLQSIGIVLGVLALLTPGSVTATNPSLVAVPEQYIEPRLEYALNIMQSTYVGREVYAWFVEAKPDLILGTPDDDWVSYYYDDPRSTIVIDEEVYRNESQDVVAALIAHETYLALATKRLGPTRERWADGDNCIEEMNLATRVSIGWWRERFGHLQYLDRPRRTGIERGFNERLYHFGGDGKWGDYTIVTSTAYREFCAQFGPLTPLDPDWETQLLAHEIVRSGSYPQLRSHLLRYWNEGVPIPVNQHVILDVLHNGFPLGYSKSEKDLRQWLNTALPNVLRTIGEPID